MFCIVASFFLGGENAYNPAADFVIVLDHPDLSDAFHFRFPSSVAAYLLHADLSIQEYNDDLSCTGSPGCRNTYLARHCNRRDPSDCNITQCISAARGRARVRPVRARAWTRGPDVE